MEQLEIPVEGSVLAHNSLSRRPFFLQDSVDTHIDIFKMRYVLHPLKTFGSVLAKGSVSAHGFNTARSLLSIRSDSLSATNQICQVVARHLRGGDVVQLIGKVGAGKTAMARGMIRSILQSDNEVVQSPTFSLALAYPCTFPPTFLLLCHFNCCIACSGPSFTTIHHVDAYR